MKKSLIITVTDLDPETAEGHDKLTEIYGVRNFAILQGEGGVNTQISLIKLLREMTGAQLRPAKKAADDIMEAVKRLGSIDSTRNELARITNNLSGNELRDLIGYVTRVYVLKGNPDIGPDRF